jgi:hypothetical protein
LASLGPDIGVGEGGTQLAGVGSGGPPPPVSPSEQADAGLAAGDLGSLALGRQPVSAHQCEGCRSCPGGVCPVPQSPNSSSQQPSAPPSATSSAAAPGSWPELKPPPAPAMGTVEITAVGPSEVASPSPVVSGNVFEQAKNVLAIIGVGALLLQGIKLAH